MKSNIRVAVSYLFGFRGDAWFIISVQERNNSEMILSYKKHLIKVYSIQYFRQLVQGMLRPISFLLHPMVTKKKRNRLILQ